MSEVLIGSKDYAMPYFNDIEISPQTLKEHLKHLQNILNRLKESGLTIKPTNVYLPKRGVIF